MGKRLQIILDLPRCNNEIVWDILDNMHPEQPYFRNYTQMIYNQFKHLPHYLNGYPEIYEAKLKLNFSSSYWCNSQGEYIRHQTREEAEQEKLFYRIEISSIPLFLELAGFPGKPSLAEVSIGPPSLFVWHKELRPIFSRIIHEFARFTKSSFAIYFPEFGQIDTLYMNKFDGDYALGEGRPVEEFIQEARKIAPPLDWNKDYDPEEQPESFWTSDNTIYFYEDLNL